MTYKKDIQYYKFCAYGFLKNQRFFEPFLILYFLEKDLSFLQIGSLYTIREIMRNIFEIPAGIFADVIGRRRTMVMSFAFYIISFVIFYISGEYWFLALAMLIYAFGDSFRTGTHKAMIFEHLKINNWAQHKVDYYGHTRSWSQIGTAVSSLIAAAIVFINKSYELIFIYSTIPFFFGLFLMISYPKALDGSRKELDVKHLKNAFRTVIQEFIISFKNVFILRAITNLSIYSGYYQAIKDYIQPILKTFAVAIPVFLSWENEQRSALIIGIVYFIIFMLSSVAARNSGRFAKQFTQFSLPLNITVLSGLTAGILSGVFYILEWYWLSIVIFIIVFLIENLRKPIGIGYVTDYLNKDILATVLSAESQVKSIFAAGFAMLLGFLADSFGVGYSIIITSIIGIVLFPFYKVKKSAVNSRQSKNIKYQSIN